MMTFRLNQQMKHKLEMIARKEGITKSEIIKQALLLFFEEYNKKNTPYDLGRDLF